MIRLAISLGLAAMLAACGASTPASSGAPTFGPADSMPTAASASPSRAPAMEGSLRTYERNSSGDELGDIAMSASGGGWTGLGGWGCMAVTLPWTISIGASDRNGAVGEYTQLLSSTDVTDPANAEIWIDVAEDGSVTWGEGMPEWAPEAAPTCGPGGAKPPSVP